MNKDKLISLIIRKQTYKDTKAYLNDLLNLKDAVKCSFQAIKQILTTDYNAQARLYAVRYLKDAFERANPSFINTVEKDLLPILISISSDQNDEKSVIKYAGSSYTKNQELGKFKAIVSSLFRMVKQCIIKWSEWIPDTNRKFIQALNQLKKKNISMEFEWKYFRPQNQQIFKQNCEKNGIKLTSTNIKPNPSKKQIKDPLILAIQQQFTKLKTAKNEKDLLKIQNDFNEAVNNYLQNAKDFKEQYIQQTFDRFQNSKKEELLRIKAQKRKQETSPNVVVNKEQLSKEKSVKKIESIKMKAQEIKIQGNPPLKFQDYDQKVQKEKTVNKVNPKTQSKKQIKAQNVQQKVNESVKKKQGKEPPSKKQIVAQQVKPQKKREPDPPKVQVADKKQLKPDPKKNIKQDQRIVIQQSKAPTSPKRPIIFEDELQSPFSSKKPSAVKQQQKVQPLKPKSRQSGSKNRHESKLSERSMDSQRVNFSDEQSSQFSQQGANRIEARDFKKKGALTPIKQQTSRGPIEQKSQGRTKRQPITEKNSPNPKNQSKSPMNQSRDFIQQKSSRLHEQQSLLSRQKRGAVTHKLIEENKYLMQKYQKLMHQYQAQRESKAALLKQKHALEKQLRYKAENQEKLVNKLKSYVPIQDYHKLRQQVEQQRQKRQNLIKQNMKLKNKTNSLIEQLNETKYRLKNIDSSENNKTKQKINESQTNILSKTQSKPITKQQIDEDYIKNLTHTSNLHKWLNKINLNLFKRNVLSVSQIAYRDQYLTVTTKSSLYTQNNEQFLSLVLTYQLKSLKQAKPEIKYKNCQELDIWIKPLVGQEQLYTQQLAIRLHSNPLKVLKVQIKIIQVIDIVFLLPILYLNFLRQQQFSNDEFDDIFAIKSQQLIKSKITQWNSQLIKQPSDINKFFKNSITTGDKIRFCLSQGINDQIFMSQLQILRNNKFLLKILPIPYNEKMTTKAKELIQNIIFLFS